MDDFHDLVRSQALLSSAWSNPAADTAMTPPPTSEKRYRCATCGQNFSRAEHLKRHQTRHTGAKPFSCIFCAREFSRKDRLQTHYGHCQRRGDRTPPSAIPKGRKPHACVTCITSKIRCDGGNPCAPCEKKKTQCVQKVAQEPSNGVDIVLLDDRVSIKALLNGGVDTFTESFNLPPSDDRIRSLEVHQRKDEPEDQSASALNSPPEKDANAIDYLGVFESPIGLDDQYLDFWTGPFGLIPSPSYSSSDTQIDLYNPSIFNVDGQTDRTSLDPSPGQPDQANFASSLNLAIYNKLWCLALEPRSRQELTTYANFLLTTEKITKFTNLYFRNWHLNCPMLHPPSFDPAEVPLSLLVSVVFIGALYSKNKSERFAAQKLIDVAELVVFDSEIFSLEIEASHVLQNESVSYAGPGGYDWAPFQELQAGFLMVIAQYWAGARIAKGRAMESRFSDVIKVVRKMRLHQARHTPSDRISETAWLQKESRIRTMSGIALLDCAMRIYTNHPCRLILVELGSDLPCKESIFNSDHPFMEDGSIFSPRLTISKAFALLFQGNVKRSLSIVKKSSEEPESEESAPSASLGDLTKFDLFILIHFLYTYILGYVMTLSFNLPTTSFAPDGGRLARGAMTADTREALAQWRISWERACAQTAGQPPKLAGMFRNAFYFWLVARSIINKEEAIDVITNMEVNCDDALTKLKVLFQNDVD